MGVEEEEEEGEEEEERSLIIDCVIYNRLVTLRYVALHTSQG